jgi:hypothetical protein
MRNHLIQRGGAIIVVVDPETKKKTIIENPIDNSRIVFDHLQTVECISVESYGSFVFVGEISSLSDMGGIFLQSQTLDKKGRPPLSQARSVSRLRNIGAGRTFTRICMKFVFVGETQGIVNGLYKKEVVTLEMAKQEVQTQHQMYRQLISGGTGVHTAIIPDAFGSCLLTCDEFELLLSKNEEKTGSSASAKTTQEVLKWIHTNAKSKGLQLYVSFIEYLEGFETFNITVKLHELNIPTIGAYVAAILLKTGCISLDMHSRNIMIHKINASVQFIDFGRIVCFFTPEALRDVKSWFNEYSEYCQVIPGSRSNTELDRLDACFLPMEGSVSAQGSVMTTASNVQAKFNAYCDALPKRLDHWLTVSSKSEETAMKEVFDLLTFIGFIDCLRGFSKKKKKQTIFTMQFGLCMNLLLGCGSDETFLMEDIVKIRSYLHNSTKWNKWLNKHPGHKLTNVVEILSELLHPDKELGSPRNPESFYFGVDSDVEESISRRSRSPSPSPSPSRKKLKKGGRKPITKKRRRISRRKPRISRRKH